MSKLSSNIKVIPLLRSAVVTLFTHKVILFPLCIGAFIQMLILEILYFAPRYPLSVFFAPIISKIWSETYLHFPFNFLLLPKLFQYLQIPIYIFISSFCLAALILIIKTINEDKTVKMRLILKSTLLSYVYVICASAIILVCVMGMFKAFSFIHDRAIIIRSEAGVFYWLKMTVLKGAPYIQLLISAFISSLFAYVLPVMIIDNKKVISAFIGNFKFLWGRFLFTFQIVLIPSLFFIPVLLIRNLIPPEISMPEIRLAMLVVSVLIMLAIDAVVYTAVTSLYLMKSED